MSALWGPWVVVLLNKSFSGFELKAHIVDFLYPPEKNSILTLFNLSTIGLGFSLLKILFSSDNESSKKVILFISKAIPSSETF